MSLVVTDTPCRRARRVHGRRRRHAVRLRPDGVGRPHLGHARLWFHADVLHRWLDHVGYDVRHVENVTDVNEKITARIGERDAWTDERDVAETFTATTFDAMRGLNLLRAEVYPRVTEHVPEIVDLVETLIEKGYAYESNGSVYFDVTAFDDYGKLSNQNVQDLEAQGEPDERSEAQPVGLRAVEGRRRERDRRARTREARPR